MRYQGCQLGDLIVCTEVSVAHSNIDDVLLIARIIDLGQKLQGLFTREAILV